jgi:hypothetical protein
MFYMLLCVNNALKQKSVHLSWPVMYMQFYTMQQIRCLCVNVLQFNN